MRDQNGSFIYTWANEVQILLNNLGFSYLWNNINASKEQMSSLIRCLYDQYYQKWFNEINTRIYKTHFQVEQYLNINNDKYRIALTRFRCCSHNVLIEEGRHRNIPKEQRLCNKCSMLSIENEYHFLLVCPFYRNLRKDYLPKYYNHWPNIFKFKKLLNASNINLLNKLSKFIYLANILRA